MPKYFIEPDIPGAGKLKPEELQAISQKSCGVIRNIGPLIQWVECFVTADKIYLHLYRARRDDGSPKCRAGRLPCQQDQRGQDPHRPHYGGIVFSDHGLQRSAPLRK
jgi:hypothetical protein